MAANKIVYLTQERVMGGNVGFIDSALRIVVGAAMVGCAATGVIGPWGYLGIVPLCGARIDRRQDPASIAGTD